MKKDNYGSLGTGIDNVVLAKIALLCALDWNLHDICYLASVIINN